MKAVLKHNRQSPRKARLVARQISRKSVPEALIILKNVPKKATVSIEKLLKSAIANAKNLHGKDAKDLYVKTITVNEGFVMKRSIPKWRGTADRILKRTSNIAIELGESKNEKATSKTKSNSKKSIKA